MASGFLGFMQGFAATGSTIAEAKAKKTDAIDIYVAERLAQQKIDTENKATAEAAIQAKADKANANFSSAADAALQPDTAPNPTMPSAATTPVNPQAGTPPTDGVAPVAPAGSITSSNLPPAQAASAPSASPFKTQMAQPTTDQTPVVAPTSMPVDKADNVLNTFDQGATPTAPTTPVVVPTTTQPAPSSAAAPLASAFDALPASEQVARAKAALPKLDASDRLAPDGGFAAAKTIAADNFNKEAADKHAKEIETKINLAKNNLDENGDPIKPVPIDVNKAKELGVPIVDNDLNPLNAMTPKDRSKSIEKLVAYTTKTDPKVLHSSDKIIEAAQNFKKIASDTTTGGASNALLLARKQLDTNVQELESLTKTLALADIGSGSGISRATQGEFYKILQANPNVTNNGPANTMMANQIIGNAMLNKEETLFRQKYIQVNKTAFGADLAYHDYLEHNPMYDPKKADFSLNPNRQTPSEFFYGGDAPPAAKDATGTAPATLSPAAQGIKDKFKNFFSK